MPQIFHHSTNALAKATIYGAVLFCWLRLGDRGIESFVLEHRAVVERQQPVLQSQTSCRDDGLDCRYCHTSVEIAASAGMPSTNTCMNCHKQIWADSPYLEPVRASFRTGKPIEWIRVHDLPDYAYFNHSIHVNKGVVVRLAMAGWIQMPIAYQASTLQMEWCSVVTGTRKFCASKRKDFRYAMAPGE